MPMCSCETPWGPSNSTELTESDAVSDHFQAQAAESPERL